MSVSLPVPTNHCVVKFFILLSLTDPTGSTMRRWKKKKKKRSTSIGSVRSYSPKKFDIPTVHKICIVKAVNILAKHCIHSKFTFWVYNLSKIQCSSMKYLYLSLQVSIIQKKTSISKSLSSQKKSFWTANVQEYLSAKLPVSYPTHLLFYYGHVTSGRKPQN